MTFTQTSNGTVRRTMTYSDQAHLLRSIEHAVTYDRFAAPRSINMQPEHRCAIIQFAGDEVAAVREWAARVGATVVHGDCTYDRASGESWHEFGTRPGGKQGQLVGWTVDLWCVVNTPSPVADAEPAEKVQAEVAPKPLQVDNAIAAAKALEPKDTGRVAGCGCHIFQDPLKDDPEVIHDTACQDWWFTFGSGHVHPDSPGINAEGGESLADRYVVIRGTYETARAIMVRFFGRVWCDQYESAERAGVERFGLVELHRRHWPTPAVDERAGA